MSSLGCNHDRPSNVAVMWLLTLEVCIPVWIRDVSMLSALSPLCNRVRFVRWYWG